MAQPDEPWTGIHKALVEQETWSRAVKKEAENPVDGGFLLMPYAPVRSYNNMEIMITYKVQCIIFDK